MTRTSKPEYIEPLINALTKLEEATEKELLEHAYNIIKPRLHQEDHQILPNDEPRWKNQMQHMLDGLIETGKIVKKEGKLKLLYL